MRVLTRTTLTVATVVALTLGATALVQAAQPSPPQPASATQANSKVVAMNVYASNVYSHDFSLLGTRIKGNRTVGPLTQIARLGTTVRFSTLPQNESYATILVTNGQETCRRIATSAHPDNANGDKKATWACWKGSSKLIRQELSLFKPVGMITLMDTYFKRDASFQVFPAPYADKGSIRIRVFDNNGHIAGVFEYTKSPSVPYSGTMYAANGKDPISSFTVTKGAQGKVVPFKTLKKRYLK